MKPRLLIVEDDPATQSIWRIVFARRGWEVAIATSIAEGLALLEPPPDYLILDLKLPDGGGDTILRRVRDAKLKTRVAVTTGTEDPGLLNLVESLELEALFEKPVDVAQVWRESMAAVDRE